MPPAALHELAEFRAAPDPVLVVGETQNTGLEVVREAIVPGRYSAVVSTIGRTYTAWDRSRLNVWNIFID